ALPGQHEEKPLAPVAAAEWGPRHAAHLLDRAGFGGSPDQIGDIAGMNPREAVAHLVDFHKVRQDERLRDFQVQPYVPPPPKPGQTKYTRNLEVFFGLVAFDNGQIQRARDWWFERMLLSTRPLEEKLTFFWHGLLTTSNADAYMSQAVIQQNKLFRRHAAGNVGELILAISKDSAMLRYLNNNANVKGRPNENYARELMELFTLGEGHYTEEDVKEAARALTGWSSGPDGSFLFRSTQHDDGEKTFLGASGNFDGADIVDIIIRQPQHARFICSEIFRFFVHDEPTRDQVNAMVWTYRTGGNRVRPVLKQLFLSKAFFSEAAMTTRVKSPVEYLVSTWKSMGLEEVPQKSRLQNDLAEMGQVPFYPPTVEGWDSGPAWITSSTLLARYNVAGRLLLGAEVDPSRPTLLLPPALAWVPVTRSPGAREAEFSSMAWVMADGATDAAAAVAATRRAASWLVGFNTNGMVTPGQCRLGGIGGDRTEDIYVPGRIG
ncbi:MAG: DUF1800 domain-containing protein, partial [Pirellulaceae bacterium]|nr:DUF1800 domain-containing protein [Pirellulaceae bacterium]